MNPVAWLTHRFRRESEDPHAAERAHAVDIMVKRANVVMDRADGLMDEHEATVRLRRLNAEAELWEHMRRQRGA